MLILECDRCREERFEQPGILQSAGEGEQANIDLPTEWIEADGSYLGPKCAKLFRNFLRYDVTTGTLLPPAKKTRTR